MEADQGRTGKRSVAIVTGAGSGIGRAVAIALAGAGFDLALLGRRRALLEETAAQCPGALVHPVDITDEEAVEQAFDLVGATFGRVDLLFNNAGIFPARASVDAISYQDWRAVIDVNLDGAFLCARAAFRRMKDQHPRGGRIINNGSVSAHVPRPEAAAYTVSKHAITGLTKSILLDGRDLGIVAGQIDIGNAETELTRALQAAARQAGATTASEPMMDAANVADAVLLMATRPLDANIPFMTIMASRMALFGRG